MKIFIDTAPLIYLCEGIDKAQDIVEKQLIDWLRANATLSTSCITLMELCVQPYRENDLKLLQRYEQNIQQLFNFPLYNVFSSTANLAAQIRAEFNFKSIDSLQLAAAVENECTLFYTNDKQLTKYPHLEIITVFS